MQSFGKLHERGKAGAQPRFPALERRGHLAHIVFQIQHRAVIEEAAPLRIETNHVEVVVHVAAGFAEDAPQHRGLNQDGGAHIEAETLLLEHRSLAAQPGILLEDLDLVAARGQRASGREPS